MQAQKLKQEVAELFRNTLRLHQKMNRRQAQGSGGSSSSRFGSAGGAAAAGSGAEVSEEEEANEPEELTEFGPSKFSYFIANIFQVRLAGAFSPILTPKRGWRVGLLRPLRR